MDAEEDILGNVFGFGLETGAENGDGEAEDVMFVAGRKILKGRVKIGIHLRQPGIQRHEHA